MLYDRGTSRQRESEEFELLRSTLSEVSSSYTWSQIKELLQEHVFPCCEKFGTWSSTKESVDRILNRKVPQESSVSSVLGPQKRRVSRPSPEQKRTTEGTPDRFSAWSLKRLKEEWTESQIGKHQIGTIASNKYHPAYNSAAFSSNPTVPSGNSSVLVVLPFIPQNSCTNLCVKLL